MSLGIFKKWLEGRKEAKLKMAWGESAIRIASEMEEERVAERMYYDRRKAIFSTEECIADLVAANRRSIHELQVMKTKNIRLTEQVCLLIEVRDLLLSGKPDEALIKAKEIDSERQT